MHVEVSVALNFVISYLYNKMPRRRVDHFGEILEKGLKKKFEGHWYPDKPFKGSGFRCIRVSGDDMDQVIEMSVIAAGLDLGEVREYLPKDLTVWVDPNEVSYRIGEKGHAKILYSAKRSEAVEDLVDMDKEIQNANVGFNPEAQSFRPIENLSSSMSNLSLSPSPNGWVSSSPTHTPQAPAVNSNSGPATSFLTRHQNRTTFTAADFAATKFGSTKLKTQAKRPTRLSPTEFSAYIKQRSNYHSPTGNPGLIPTSPFYGPGGVLPSGSAPFPGGRHRSLSPRGVQNDFLEHQHRIAMLQQQQQQQQQGFPQSPQHQPPSLLLGSNGLLSPTGGSLCDIYHSAPQSTAVSPVGSAPELQQSPTKMSSLPSLQSTPSPTEPNKTFIDSLNWTTLPQYANLQHMLVAN